MDSGSPPALLEDPAYHDHWRENLSDGPADHLHDTGLARLQEAMTVTELHERILAEAVGLASSSIQRKREVFGRFSGWRGMGARDIKTVKRLEVAEFVLEVIRESDLASATISMCRMEVIAAFKWAHNRGYLKHLEINTNNLPKVAPGKKDRKAFTFQLHQKILTELGTRRRHLWVRGICVVAWHTGMRLSDICCLTWSAIDLDEEVITVIPMKTRRLGKLCRIPMEPELRTMLLQLRSTPYQEWHRDSPYVFPEANGLYGQRNGKAVITSLFQSILGQIGIQGYSFHCYRHAFVSRLVKVGTHPMVISSMTGQSVEVINGYAHIDKETARVALDTSRQSIYRSTLEVSGMGGIRVPFQPEPVKQ